ncbi:hypothetical protein H9657_15010 [Cellulomonas sp. Sa3CUA2]|uniref:Major facilitator superfamily (MFS) profile domain-containing protein n=1 Tax=Cellulomonas avistercoris TaxID=2762242 RepID=A0ABR8QGL4_9CELL|nr:hypothetical protein [Cellulomonas avistercoris]MBD7919579.1 hypothetical protein [Cellulomonas avistercoris]
MSSSQVPAATADTRSHAPARQAAEQLDVLGVLELTVWCGLLLVTVNSGIGLLTLALSGVWPGAVAFGVMLAVASFGALVPVLVVGWPAGVLTAWLLRREPRESRHVVVFAVVGAVAAVLLGLVGRDLTPDPAISLLLAAEGALGAGGGRLLVGRSRRALVRRRAAQRAHAAATAEP